jgi:arsenate reductase (thioredoxin)
VTLQLAALPVGLPLLLLLAAAAQRASEPPQAVVFVCEHGSVKSLIAREWFTRLAAARGLHVRAVSRGVTPDPSVPAAVADHLRQDGFDVGGFQPRPLAPADLEGALRVVTIGAELPAWVARAGRPVESWDGVPPASEGYEGSRDALRKRIAALVEALAARPRPR